MSSLALLLISLVALVVLVLLNRVKTDTWSDLAYLLLTLGVFAAGGFFIVPFVAAMVGT